MRLYQLTFHLIKLLRLTVAYFVNFLKYHAKLSLRFKHFKRIYSHITLALGFRWGKARAVKMYLNSVCCRNRVDSGLFSIFLK